MTDAPPPPAPEPASTVPAAPDPAPIAATTAAPAPESGRRVRGAIFEIAETLVLTVVIFLGIQTFLAQPFKVQQVSMESTLLPDQYVLIDKLTPRWSGYERGDIVVFNPPADWVGPGDTPLIKRVIGLPGDQVELRNGSVFVNGTKLDEPYVYRQPNGQTQATNPIGDASQWVVPQGQLFVMGDHRGASEDSRAFGPIPTSSVIGRAFLRYWPIDTLEVISRPTY